MSLAIQGCLNAWSTVILECRALIPDMNDLREGARRIMLPFLWVPRKKTLNKVHC